MNGIHDMGGLDGFGAIPADDGVLFHEEWERRLFGCFVAIMNAGLFPVHRIRHANERMPPRAYLASPYYGRWLFALETCLVEGGYLPGAGGEAASCRIAGSRLSPEQAICAIRDGQSSRLGSPVPARFAVGETVTVSIDALSTHTRVPRYVRGRAGTITSSRGSFVFPDSAAHDDSLVGQPLYTVRFASESLWGKRADRHSDVFVDLFESYLHGPGSV